MTKRLARVLFCVFTFVVAGLAQTPVPAATAAAETPLSALPYSPSLDVSSMDTSVDPCADFYAYSCGGWMKQNPIPADQASWDVYGKLHNDNQRFLWGILDDLAHQSAGRTAIQQKIGDYFAACMDEAAVEKLGAKPLQPQLDALAALKSKQDLPALLARMHLENDSDGLLFNFSSNQDFENSNDVIAFADSGGIGLPDRDYYTKTDEKSVQLRKQYVAHVQRMLELLGDEPGTAQRAAARVLAIETSLAKATLTRVEKRDPYNLFHKMDRIKLQALTPDFAWNAYLDGIGIGGVQTFNVTEPAYFKEVERQLKALNLRDLKTYLRWHVLHANAPYLSAKFVNENFEFFSRTLRGTQQLRPRW